jgi:glycosyltransferase involved in cell wall biosynthesis
LPSYTENFGGVVVDALAVGVPVLASKATPWGILNKRGCGVQFELTPESLSNALYDFIKKSDNERLEMGRRGRELVLEKYTWDAIGREKAKAYEGVLKKN